MRAQVGKFTLSGDGLCIGYDSGDAVSEWYKSPGEFKGGTIRFVGSQRRKAQYLDLEMVAAAMSAMTRGSDSVVCCFGAGRTACTDPITSQGAERATTDRDTKYPPIKPLRLPRIE